MLADVRVLVVDLVSEIVRGIKKEINGRKMLFKKELDKVKAVNEEFKNNMSNIELVQGMVSKVNELKAKIKEHNELVGAKIEF